MTRTQWWQTAVIYQIYPRSFQDSSGDGVGDLAGITSRLGYLSELGVDAIWISPIFHSPMKDFGYDISDYTAIDPLFGAMADFEKLLRTAHSHGLKLLLDFVPNHSSDQHPWFIESQSSQNSPKRDWYIWRDPAPDGGTPNNWLSEFGGSAWEFGQKSGQYYYHAFLSSQPDLNWRNPAVVEAMHDVLRFWLAKGVDGFRVDVIWHLIKDSAFRDNPANPDYRPGKPPHQKVVPLYTTDLPEVHDVIAGIRRVVDEFDDRLLIGEIYLPIERLVAYYGRDLDGAHLPFNFTLLNTPWDARKITQLVSEYEAALPRGGWPNWVLGNHDQPRIAGRIGSPQAAVAAILLLTLRGTPTIYYGEELGMPQALIPADRVRDPFEKNVPGMGVGRDGSRTPMQWDATTNAGFSTSEPWLPLAEGWKSLNVENLEEDGTSILNLYKRLVRVRRKSAALARGAYRPYMAESDFLIYFREYEDERVLIVLNLTHIDGAITFPRGQVEGSVLVSIFGDRDGEAVSDTVVLRGDEGLVIGLDSPPLTDRGSADYSLSKATVDIGGHESRFGPPSRAFPPGSVHRRKGLASGGWAEWIDDRTAIPIRASTETIMEVGAEWWQTGVVYQIYPRSFQDSNADGVGDINGIQQRLQHLVDLGVDAIWISPIFPSPMRDFGYDVSDYCEIDPLFGSLADLDSLVAAAHARGLKVILDFVPNHTSDRHPWFQESRSSRFSPKRDWYVWRDARADGSPPNNWESEFGGPAWTLDDLTGYYYYHAFLKEQPDLNWRNPAVGEAMGNVLRFWLERGIDGFRVDAIHHLIEDEQLRDNPSNPSWRPGMPPKQRWVQIRTIDQPETHEAIRQMRRVAGGYPDRVMIGEAYLPIDRLMAYYGADLGGFQLPFNFHLISARWQPPALSAVIEAYEAALPAGAWPNWVLGNHDRSRVASRLGPAQARVAAMLLLTLRGTPTIYQGEEIGMTDVPIPPHLVQDPWEKNVPGFGLGRDPERTPIPWTRERHAGFTSGEPWLPIGADGLDVSTQANDPKSILALYRALIQLRRSNDVFTLGWYRPRAATRHVLAHERRHRDSVVLIALNLTSEVQELSVRNARREMLLSTYLDDPGSMSGVLIQLRANEGLIMRETS